MRTPGATQMDGWLARWTRAMIRWRWLVIAVWIAVLVGSLAAVRDLSDLLTNRFTLPGTDTERVEGILEDEFDQRSAGSFILLAEANAGNVAALLPALRDAAARAAEAVPTGKVVFVTPVSEDVASATIVSNLVPADAKGYTDDVRAAAGTIEGASLSVTGQAAIESDLEPIQDEDLQKGEFLIAIPIALLILVAVFGTFAFLIPLMFAVSAIPATLGVVWFFANAMELSTYVTQLVSLIGLGIAVDYSLLVVYRYREERDARGDKAEAIVATMETAGRAVVFSGTAVAIGLALLLALPMPFIRGFGIAGLTIPIVSVICALTLLPVLLYFTADGLDRVRLLPRRFIARGAEREGAFWMRLARSIMRRPAAYVVLSMALLLAAAIPAFWINVGPGTNQGIPQNLESTRALNVLGDAAGEGAIAPTEIVIDTGRSGGAADPQVLAAATRLEQGLAADPEVVSVVRLPGAQGVDAQRPLSSPSVHRPQRVRRSLGDGLRRSASRRDRAGRSVPGWRRGLRGWRTAVEHRFPRPDVRHVPLAGARGARAHVRAAPARLPIAAAAAEGNHPQPPLDRRGVRPPGRVLQVGRRRRARPPEL